MKKLWQKQYKLNEAAEQYCSGENVILDNHLVIQDVVGTMAHTRMLAEINILSKKEYLQVQSILNNIIELYHNNKFVVTFGDEDVHTKVENYITKQLGDIGKKVHTARSRNDQINVDLRLYGKDKLFETYFTTIQVIESFLSFAKKHEFIPMPGYTHMQKAMPSSVGLWSASFAESLADDLEILKCAFLINNKSPLGSGAAYGVSLPINREMTSELLGFDSLVHNSLYAQVSRCKNQFTTLHALSQIMLTLSRFAEDILLFTMSEFDYFTVPEELCTGSSIMPQKKNVDIMEILRAKSHKVMQLAQLNGSVLSGLPSGYNSDFAETKEALISGFQTTIDSLHIVKIVVDSLKLNTEKISAANSKEIYATHAAYKLVKKGIPFRDAYNVIAKDLNKVPQYNALEVIKETNHTGAPGNLQLHVLKNQIRSDKKWWQKKFKQYNDAITNLRESAHNDYSFY